MLFFIKKGCKPICPWKWNQQNLGHDHMTQGKLLGHFYHNDDAGIAWDPSWATPIHSSASFTPTDQVLCSEFLIKTQGLRYISPSIRLPARKWPQCCPFNEACCLPCFTTRSDSLSQAEKDLFSCPANCWLWVSSFLTAKWGYLSWLESPWAQEMQATTASRLSKILTAV